MRTRPALLLCIPLFALLACSLFSQAPATEPPLFYTQISGTLTALVASPLPSKASGTLTPPSQGTPSLTPLPPGPTATLTVTPTPTASATPTETLMPYPGDGFPPPAASIPQPAGQVTIILLGTDQRTGAPDFRTDTMILLVLRPDGSASLVSFPRDLWVYLPGLYMQRINTAQEYGGFSLLQATFQYNFGFRPGSYVLTNFNGFRAIVDGLGGIDVYVGQDFTDPRTGYGPDGFTLNVGNNHLDGDTALWYVRARQSTGDLDRLRRAQEVLTGIGRRLVSLDGLAHIPDLYPAFRGAVVSDLTLQDVTDLVPVLQKVDPNRVTRYTFGLDQVIPVTLNNGAEVLLPNSVAVRQVLLQALGSP